jgi:MOSC domain-containing protein YiiM
LSVRGVEAFDRRIAFEQVTDPLIDQRMRTQTGHITEDTTADACGYEANADSQEGSGSKGDEPDANKAHGGEANTLTLATQQHLREPQARLSLLVWAVGLAATGFFLRGREVVAPELHNEA